VPVLSIREALDRFVAGERDRAPGSVADVERALESLEDFLEGYGYQYVDEEDEEYVDEDDESFDDEEGSFVEANTPDILPEALTEFLFEWQIREHPGDPEESRVTSEVAERLMDWLAEERLARVADARDAAALARRAADEVPRAKQLGKLLHPLTREVPDQLPTSEDEVVEDFFRIVRVEPGRMWLEQEVGPIAVPEEASAIADVGWWVNVVATRLGGTWYLSEVGNVYPLLAEGAGEDWEDAAEA
jgi:hypothetical protein